MEVEPGKTFLDNLNPSSLTVLDHAFVEPCLSGAEPGQYWQFERTGYFTADPDSTADLPVFNRTVSLRDTWARMEKNKTKS